MVTRFPGGQDIARKWFVVDASGQTLGRLASRVASILAGKESALYTPFIDAGDHVIVINAGKIRVTGMKTEQKMYRHYTGFPGGLREEQFRKLFDRASGPRGARGDPGHAAQEQAGQGHGQEAESLCRRQARSPGTEATGSGAGGSEAGLRLLCAGEGACGPQV